MSTKEMAPGARLDTLDDHAAAWNFRKIVGFGECSFPWSLLVFMPFSQGTGLGSQLKKAIEMRANHEALFVKFSKKFSQGVLSQWEKMVIDWDEDHTRPNPYEESRVCKCSIGIECHP
jgi:hypothetical protein